MERRLPCHIQKEEQAIAKNRLTFSRVIWTRIIGRISVSAYQKTNTGLAGCKASLTDHTDSTEVGKFSSRQKTNTGLAICLVSLTDHTDRTEVGRIGSKAEHLSQITRIAQKLAGFNSKTASLTDHTNHTEIENPYFTT